MVAVQDSTLDRRRLNQVLGHVSRPKIRTASFSTQLRLHVNTLFQQNPLKKRVLVAQHQALVGSMAMGSLEVSQVLLMGADGLLELLDVLGSALTKSSLGLTVPLLSLLRCRIDLLCWLVHVCHEIRRDPQHMAMWAQKSTYRFATPFSLGLLVLGLGRGVVWRRLSFRAGRHGLYFTVVVFGWIFLVDRHLIGHILAVRFVAKADNRGVRPYLALLQKACRR